MPTDFSVVDVHRMQMEETIGRVEPCDSVTEWLVDNYNQCQEFGAEQVTDGYGWSAGVFAAVGPDRRRRHRKRSKATRSSDAPVGEIDPKGEKTPTKKRRAGERAADESAPPDSKPVDVAPPTFSNRPSVLWSELEDLRMAAVMDVRVRIQLERSVDLLLAKDESVPVWRLRSEVLLLLVERWVPGAEPTERSTESAVYTAEGGEIRVAPRKDVPPRDHVALPAYVVDCRWPPRWSRDWLEEALDAHARSSNRALEAVCNGFDATVRPWLLPLFHALFPLRAGAFLEARLSRLREACLSIPPKTV